MEEKIYGATREGIAKTEERYRYLLDDPSITEFTDAMFTGRVSCGIGHDKEERKLLADEAMRQFEKDPTKRNQLIYLNVLFFGNPNGSDELLLKNYGFDD